jgi:ABC-2 type transport system permease protein/oleandomycin transport system permease protein
MIAVGLLIGFRFHGGAAAIIGVPLLTLLFAIPFSWVAAMVGTSVRSVEAANLAGFVWMFPVTFVSSAFVPIESMPGWLQPIAQANPFSVAVDAVRALALGEPATRDVLKTLAWAVGITVVVAPLAIRKYQRV